MYTPLKVALCTHHSPPRVRPFCAGSIAANELPIVTAAYVLPTEFATVLSSTTEFAAVLTIVFAAVLTIVFVAVLTIVFAACVRMAACATRGGEGAPCSNAGGSYANGWPEWGGWGPCGPRPRDPVLPLSAHSSSPSRSFSIEGHRSISRCAISLLLISHIPIITINHFNLRGKMNAGRRANKSQHIRFFIN